MARDQVTITITSPQGSGLKVASPDQPRPDDSLNLDLFSPSKDAVPDELSAPTPPGATESDTAPTMPWEDLSRGSKSMNFQPDPKLYAKMMWCKENVPMMSLQKLARLGTEKFADELIAKHYSEQILAAG
jgi:hypothetical protein